MSRMSKVNAATATALLSTLVTAQTTSAQVAWELLPDFMDPRTGGSGIEGAAASLIDGTLYVSHGFRAGDTAFLSAFSGGGWTHGGGGLPDALVVRSEGAGHSQPVGVGSWPRAADCP